MKKLLANTLTLIILLTLSASAESLLGGKISITIPQSFEKLSSQVMQRKWPGPNRPAVAYGTPTGAVTIAAKSTAAAVPDSELGAFKKAMRQNIQRARPDAQFETDEIITIKGQKWAHFVFTSQAPDGAIRNEMLIGSKGGKVYILNLNATVAEYATYKKDLAKARRSVKIK